MNKYIRIILLGLFIVVINNVGKTTPIAVKNDSIKNFHLTAFPLIYYLPESSFGFGGAGIATFRFKGEKPNTRPSSFQFGATYTLKNQVLTFLPFELYFQNERKRLVGELGYFKYFYNFYGIGFNSSKENLENYDVIFPRLRATFLQQIRGPLSGGFTYQFDAMKITKREENGILSVKKPVGYDGGTISNIGGQLLFDTRDNIFYPYKGVYVQFDALFSFKEMGSSFSYQKYILDIRYFYQISTQSAIGFQLYTGNIQGNPPFFDMFYLGTPLLGRGIGDRRYIDRNIYAAQSEYRFPIYKRIGGVFFATINSVSPELGNLKKTNFIPSVGTGIRINVNKKERNQVRIDAGYNREGFNFYATASNAF